MQDEQILKVPERLLVFVNRFSGWEGIKALERLLLVVNRSQTGRQDYAKFGKI